MDINVGDKVTVKSDTEYISGTVTQVEICFFRVVDDWYGNVCTFHWNEKLEIKAFTGNIVR